MVSALSWLISSAPLVAGHGYMTIPEVRARKYGKYRYEPQSLGAVGPGGAITVCGRGGASNFNEVDAVTKLPAPGSKFTIQAKITAHHFGHMTVRMCRFLDSGTKHEDLKDQCVRLKGTKSGKDVWPLSAATGVKEWEVTLPSKQELTKLGTNLHKGVYTIQWRWNTANSCKPSKDVEDPESNCNEEKCCSEVFTNCADVVFDGVPFDAPKEVENPHKPEPIPAPSPGGGADAGAGGGCLREEDVTKNPWAADDDLITWCSTLKGAEECTEAQQCHWAGAGAGPEPEPEAEPESPHEMSPTEEAQKQGLKGVKQFCDLNKAYFCDQKNPAAVGNEICECSPADPDSKPEPESEPEAKPEPESKPESKPEPEPKSKPEPKLKPDPKSKGSAPTDPSQCNSFKKWCQEDACNFNVKKNQCWGAGPTTYCLCSDDPKTERAGDWPGLLQMTQPGESSTKFSGKVTRQIGAHGEIQP